jgi:hypothetical protein
MRRRGLTWATLSRHFERRSEKIVVGRETMFGAPVERKMTVRKTMDQ